MVKHHYGLPSLKMIGTFEAAGRLKSFKDAADELHVTPGAVSHQIRSLEQELDMKLFLRESRAVNLTPEGKDLFEVVSSSLNEIGQTVKKLRELNETQHISIGSTTAVLSMWLSQKIAQFWREYGHIQINQEVRDRPFRRPLSLDMIVEYSTNPPEETSNILFEDTLLPLCSPEFEGKNISRLEQLSKSYLIHLDAKDTNWTSWANWFETLDYNGEISVRHRVNNYAIALQLAQDGMGVVLGWRHLVKPLIESGSLIPLTKYEIAAPGKFYLVQSKGNQKKYSKIFSEWLLLQDK
ncbi:MAG: LysR family transcriptional regulator [Amylibacter sp.]|jgi:DNA-binding transcriptional LysR family regulator|nr:LysR family transcriptional regulator [Amylibacter sp.]MDA8803035.1 LysR family transcriptional regulator [Amylibacter sp.]MDA9581727.1 LysR family transcriptional regulator [Amylibacter sp.]MDB2676296.1 LysR family transcriptional regulator [Amylibacter sp.]MDC0489457.1 LysR family transcriptional regulator [Amylibacter sp.]